MTTTEAQTVHTMTEQEATDEALLLFTRKVRRLHSEAFAEVWAMLPDGAKEALGMAEARADLLRDRAGIKNLAYPPVEFEDED